jgi:Glycosyl hydrolases family 43
MGSRREKRWIALVAALLAVTITGANVGIDVVAHTRAHQERQLLRSAQRQLVRSHDALATTRNARALALNQRDSLVATATTMSGQMTTTKGALGSTNVTAYLQALAIKTLQTCLGGVRGALHDISTHDQGGATQDIAAVSNACRMLDDNGAGGLVYPYDFPDPFVLRVGSAYFAYATNSTEGNIQIIASNDLSHWNAVGNALPVLPTWATPGGTWAPSVLQIGNSFVLYYAVAVAGRLGEECISDATAAQPQGPFVDDSTSPLVCQSNRNGSIDPSPFVDANGSPYLEWKSNGGPHQPSVLWSAELNAAGTGFTGSAPSPMLASDHGWDAGVIEAPDMVLFHGRYLLFYSGNNWNSSGYAVGWATCEGPLGPCAEPLTKPILTSGADTAGPGGESVFTDSGGSVWIAFAAWVPGEVGYPNSRTFYLHKLDLSGSSPVVEPTG